MKTGREYMNESPNDYIYNNVIIKFNEKVEKGTFDDRVEKRLNNRSDLSVKDFKKKLNKFIDSKLDDFKMRNGIYLCIFIKSNIKLLLKFTKKAPKKGEKGSRFKGTTIVLTILDIDIGTKRDDYAITLNESIQYLFDYYRIDIEDNEYVLHEEENDEEMDYCIGFMIENQIKKIDHGVGIINIEM